jgi:hypothetical protein
MGPKTDMDMVAKKKANYQPVVTQDVLSPYYKMTAYIATPNLINLIYILIKVRNTKM